jgi:hypothetical protein
MGLLQSPALPLGDPALGYRAIARQVLKIPGIYRNARRGFHKIGFTFAKAQLEACREKKRAVSSETALLND